MKREVVRSRIARFVQGAPASGDGPEWWVDARRAWRHSPRVGRRQLDLVLRSRSAATLPGMGRDRLLALGLPREVIDRTLGRVRSVSGWHVAWTATAQAFLGETRRVDGADHEAYYAQARSWAALAYHAAVWLAYDDEPTMRTLRSARTALFARAVRFLIPRTEAVRVPWRASELPGYLRLPVLAQERRQAAPLVVVQNGATTANEETILWTDAFAARGLAVLAIDQPGTGEAFDLGPPSGEHDDLLDGVRDLAAADPRLDGSRIALVGFSLGGAQAVKIAAVDRRLAACVAITPPYEPGAWLHAANPLMLDQLAGHLGAPYIVMELAEGFELPELAPRLRCPLLVLGAGRDLVVPPAESQRLAAAASELGTLLWYARAGHGLYEIMPTWTADVAAWLGMILDEPDTVPVNQGESTGVDSVSQAASGGSTGFDTASQAALPVAPPATDPSPPI